MFICRCGCLIDDWNLHATRTYIPMIFVCVCHIAALNSILQKTVGMVCPYNHIQLGLVFDLIFELAEFIFRNSLYANYSNSLNVNSSGSRT